METLVMLFLWMLSESEKSCESESIIILTTNIYFFIKKERTLA